MNPQPNNTSHSSHSGPNLTESTSQLTPCATKKPDNTDQVHRRAGDSLQKASPIEIPNPSQSSEANPTQKLPPNSQQTKPSELNLSQKESRSMNSMHPKNQPDTNASNPSKLTPLLFLLTFLLPSLLIGMLFTACELFDGDDPGRGVEVENEFENRLFLPDGTPASGIEVVFYDVSHLPAQNGGNGNTGALTKTSKTNAAALRITPDTNGDYTLTGLPAGEYNLLANNEQYFIYKDILTINNETEIGNDTLATPGSITGYVELEPQHDPQSVTIQILGTNQFTGVSSDGSFKFRNLGAGQYSVKATTKIPEYADLFASFVVTSGLHDTLADTLRPAFTGIPVVKGLAADYDTLNGVVKLTWNKTKYRNFQDYLIYLIYFIIHYLLLIFLNSQLSAMH